MKIGRKSMITRQWAGTATKTVTWRTSVVQGLLDITPGDAEEIFGDLRADRRRFVVADAELWACHGDQIALFLKRLGIEYGEPPLLLPGGESAKTRENADRVIAEMDDFGLGRFGGVIGWGGGVLHDVLGVAAGEYRRGIRGGITFVATTVLCAVDAAFALKCAVNGNWKNRVGLYSPMNSVCDPVFFRTLNDVDIRDGFAEIVKWALAGDGHLFDLIEEHGARVANEKFQRGDSATRSLLTRPIAVGMAELTSNPWEDETARPSYLGHNWSPVFEPSERHGQAVALDMLISAMIAWRKGFLSRADRDRIVRTIGTLGLKLWSPVLEDRELMRRALWDAALHRGGRQYVPLPYQEIGKVTFCELTETDVQRGCEDLYGYVAAEFSQS
jgi:3-dehydroquinate synthase